MPKIRHLAIKTKDPARLAKFYEEVFGMKVIHSEKSGAMYMSDGYLTLAILRNRGEATPSGINHFGFQVDDLEDIEKRLAKWDEPMTAGLRRGRSRNTARWTRTETCSTSPCTASTKWNSRPTARRRRSQRRLLPEPMTPSKRPHGLKQSGPRWLARSL